MKTRILSLLLCLVMVMSVMMTACKKEETPEATTTTPAAEDDNMKLLTDMLPANVDLEGREIVLATQYLQHGFELEDYTGDPIEDCMYERNMYLEERFNCDLKLQEGEGSTALRQAHLAQADLYDLVYAQPDQYIPLAVEGAFTDLLSLEHLNLEQEWWNQSQVQGWTLNNHLYVATGDSTITGQGFCAVVYNEEKYAQMGFTEDLYQVVYEKKWTIEKMHELVVASSVFDESGNGTYGLCMWENISGRFMQASGQNVLERNDEGVFELGFTQSKVETITDALYDMLKDTNANIVSQVAYNASMQTSNFFTAFMNGQGMFMTFDIGSLWWMLRDIEFGLDYLPLPKYAESQKNYYSMCASGCIGIPYYDSNPDQVSIIFEAMTNHSYLKLKPEFFNRILQGRLSGDPEDFEMLDFLHSTKFFDVGFGVDTKQKGTAMIQNLIYDLDNPGAINSYMKGATPYFNEIIDTANSME